MSTTWAVLRVIAPLCLAVSAAASCTSSKLSSTGPSTVKCQVSANGTVSSIAASGGTATLSVTANPECAWTATSDVGWITDVAPSSGQGSGNVTLHVVPNAEPVARRGMVHVAAADVQITQDAAPCVFTVTPLTRSMDASGGTTTVAVSANSACTWTAASAQSWISVQSGARGVGNGIVTLIVAENSGAERSGAVTVAGQSVTVDQSAPVSTPVPSPPVPPSPPTPSPPSPPGPSPTPLPSPAPASCSYTITPTSQSFMPNGGGGTVNVTTTTGCAWTVVSNASWVTITNSGPGTGNGTVHFTVAANTGSAPRTGTITVAGRTFTVSESVTCTYEIAPASQTFSLSGGTGSIAVTAPVSCAWTATSKGDWVTVTGGASGSGNGTVAYKADAASSNKDRNTEIKIATETFKVIEAKD